MFSDVDQWDPYLLSSLVDQIDEQDSHFPVGDESINDRNIYNVKNNTHIAMDGYTTALMPEYTTMTQMVNGTAILSIQSQIDVHRHVTLVIFILTFIFGSVGNTLTIVVIMMNSKMKTVASCFILNLAIADCLFIFR